MFLTVEQVTITNIGTTVSPHNRGHCRSGG